MPDLNYCRACQPVKKRRSRVGCRTAITQLRKYLGRQGYLIQRNRIKRHAMPVITVRHLGGIGRFGNQCALYCFAKGYARRYGAELQCSNWIGREIFENANEPFVSDPHLPQTILDSNTREPLDRYFGRVNIDLRVYAQSSIYQDGFYTRQDVRNWLKLKPKYEAFAPKERPLSVAHLRLGDIVDHASFSKYYCSVTEQSYDDAIEQFNIPKPVIKVFEGWRKPPPELPAGLDWLSDWLLMRDAQHLLRANSTFSMFAAWCGNGKVYAPIVEDKAGPNWCEFTEGNWPCTAGKFHNQSDLFLKEQ